MARLPRYAIPNQPQHIIQRSKSGQQIFYQATDYQYFHDCLAAAAHNHSLKVHAYVLMPTRVHILATPTSAKSVSRSIQSIGRNYVQYFNECTNGRGSIWEGRYRATVIDSRQFLLTCSRFIELEPVRSGLAKHPKDYPWSSYPHNAGGRLDDLISPHREYLKLGEDRKERARAYRDLFKQKLSAETVEQITEATLKGWALGDDKFVRKIEDISGRRATQLPKGRPRSVQKQA